MIGMFFFQFSDEKCKHIDYQIREREKKVSKILKNLSEIIINLSSV